MLQEETPNNSKYNANPNPFPKSALSHDGSLPRHTQFLSLQRRAGVNITPNRAAGNNKMMDLEEDCNDIIVLQL